MLTHNKELTRIIPGQSAGLTVVLEAPKRAELDNLAAKQMAIGIAASNGFPLAGLSQSPRIGPIDAVTGELMDGNKMLDPASEIAFYRGEFHFATMP